MGLKSSGHVVGRRDFLSLAALGVCGLGVGGLAAPRQASANIGVGLLPKEPLEIGNEPQFVFDLHAVDSTWALHEKLDPVMRVFHGCQKHAANPMLTGDNPSHFWVVRDEESGLFRMWYQLNQRIDYKQPRQKGQPFYQTFLAYAESNDGVAWKRPQLDLFKDQPDGANLPRNCVMHRRRPNGLSRIGIPHIVEVPEADRRDYRYHMLYLERGIRLIGSRDGIHWDPDSDTLLSPIGSDHHNTIVYDPKLQEYVMFLRAKHIYLAPGQREAYDTIEKGAAGVRLNTGQSRRGVARMTSKGFWDGWTNQPQQIIVPDELDAQANYNFFYGMPVRYWAGIYWGFVQVFRMNDYMHVQLAWSRDGINFDRLPLRPKLVEYGPDGSWDDTMLLACPNWIEVGDQWWVYYCGSDGPHNTADKGLHVGLAMFRKEGFISLRGPSRGGVVCTRQIRWPGGSLRVNADARGGEMRVRVSDALRKPVPGYNYEDGPVFSGNSVSHEVTWNGRSLDAFKDRIVRLEFFLKGADLFTFRAASST